MVINAHDQPEPGSSRSADRTTRMQEASMTTRTVAGWIAVALLFSVLLGIIATSYVGWYEEMLLTPVRNLIVLGQPKPHEADEIGPTRYAHAEGINPVHIAQLARPVALDILMNQEEALRLPEVHRERLLDVADFFVSEGQIFDIDGLPFKVWWYEFDYPYYGLKAPWLSGMAQGQALEVLLAAYEITDNEVYLENARLAANTLAVAVDDGGSATYLENGAIWFEEYAQAGVAPPRVLNGHNFALEGLWFLCQREAGYCSLYDKGVQGSRTLLPEFDGRIWSFYDLAGTPANPKYQRIHVQQLRDLEERTGEEIFSRYAKRFEFQLYLPFSAPFRLVHYPNRFLILTTGLNITFVFLLLMAVGYWSHHKSRREKKVG